MKPYYRSKGITIFNGDCREVLPQLPKVDCLITDPPYGIVNKFGAIQIKDGGTRLLQFPWDSPEVTATVLTVLNSCLPGVKSAFVFCGADQITRVIESARGSGMVAKTAAWVKKYPAPAAPGNWWPSGFELAMYSYRRGAWFGDADTKRSNVFVSDSYRHGQPGKVAHPTQKPLGLMERIVGSLVEPQGSLLDPFMGSGTTLVAARNLGRKAIGIELEEKYCEIAAKRLEERAVKKAA